MQTFHEIREHCERSKMLNRTLIDEFLIRFAANNTNLVPEMETAIKKYKYAAAEIPATQLNFLRSEYIAHRIFRTGGLIHKFLKDSALQRLTPEQMDFLRFKSLNPWRFSFAEITSNPEDSFFKMEDVMTGDDYLLYSPGMQTTLKELKPRLWFNLIAFNGKCWQSFGLIIPFLSFSADDLFFFATELNPKISDEEMFMAEVEMNPFPFFMLICASVSPMITSRGHVTLICQSSDIIPGIQIGILKESFEVTRKGNVYRLNFKELETIPHFAQAFFNENTGELQRTSMTEYGFKMLTEELLNCGIKLPPEPDLVVSPSMHYAAEKILNKKIELNRYEKYFSPIEKQDEKISGGFNRFLNMALPFYNTGKEFDISELAAKAGIDPAMASELWIQVKKKTDEMKNKHK